MVEVTPSSAGSAENPSIPSGPLDRSAEELLRNFQNCDGAAFERSLAEWAKLKDARLLPGLVELIKRLPLARAHSVAQVVATIGGEEARSRLLQALRESTDTDTRWAIVYGLTWLLDPASFETFLTLVESSGEPSAIRIQAAEGAAYLAVQAPADSVIRQRATQVFLQKIYDADDGLRLWSVRGLGMFGSRSVVEPLQRLAEELAREARGSQAEGELLEEVRDALATVQQLGN